MSDILIRDLDEDLLAQLKLRAASKGRSVEEEARAILTAAFREPAEFVEPGNVGRPVWGSVPGLRANCPPNEATAPVFPDGIPWHDQDPV